MEYECENPECKNIFIKINKQRFCTLKCAHRHNYLKNKNKYLAKARRWDAKNPDKCKECRSRARDKFRKNKPERWNKLVMDCYWRDKEKHYSRGKTRRILSGDGFKKYNPLKKQCKCGSTENLTLKFDIYTIKTEEIKKALDNGKIYYICKECRSSVRKPKSI